MSIGDDLLEQQREFNSVFGTEEGRRVLSHILTKLCGMEAIVTDPEAAQIAIGSMNVGKAILNIMNKPVSDIAELRRRPRK
jgi:hypothetical protein